VASPADREQNDTALRVCLSRSLELNAVTLRFQDWPGLGGPLVHFAVDSSQLAVQMADALAPRYRVLCLSAREGVSYQTDAADLRELLLAFGFSSPLLLGEGLGCLAPLLVAAWWPELVGGLLLVAPVRDAAPGLAGRGLKECPPDWDALLALVRCPNRVRDSWSAEDAEALLSGRAAG
jgi:pimeloyl-ACP methyl ester carboxylesterase